MIKKSIFNRLVFVCFGILIMSVSIFLLNAKKLEKLNIPFLSFLVFVAFLYALREVKKIVSLVFNCEKGIKKANGFQQRMAWYTLGVLLLSAIWLDGGILYLEAPAIVFCTVMLIALAYIEIKHSVYIFVSHSGFIIEQHK